jgi:hypothetical protein
MRQVRRAQEIYGIGVATARAIIISPYVIFVTFFVLLWLPQTSDFTDRLTHPKHPLEWTMFAVHLIAGIYGLRLAWLAKKNGEPRHVYWFCMLFSIALLWVAGEINAWGQKFFDYGTPSWFAQHNAMGLVTLHNLEGWDDRNHWLRLTFAVGGFIGIAAQRSLRWKRLSAPTILATWFALIAFKSVLDIWVKNFPITSSYDWDLFNWVINRLSKIVKIMIGIASLIYLWLNRLRFEREWSSTQKAPAV